MGCDRYATGRFAELLNYALNPADEDAMEELFQAGFESGELFLFIYFASQLFSRLTEPGL